MEVCEEWGITLCIGKSKKKQDLGATLQNGVKESFKSQKCRQSLLMVGKGKLVAMTPDGKQVLGRTGNPESQTPCREGGLSRGWWRSGAGVLYLAWLWTYFMNRKMVYYRTSDMVFISLYWMPSTKPEMRQAFSWCCMDGWKHVCVETLMDGWMEALVHGYMNGYTCLFH